MNYSVITAFTCCFHTLFFFFFSFFFFLCALPFQAGPVLQWRNNANLLRYELSSLCSYSTSLLFIQSIIVSLCLPRVLDPSILPSKTVRRRDSLLNTWSNQFFCLCRIVFIKLLFSSTMSKTSWLDRCSVQLIFINFHQIHISNASSRCMSTFLNVRFIRYNLVNPWECRGNYSATWNDIKLVQWPLMGELLHLVQWREDWAGPQPAQAPPRWPNVTDYSSNAPPPWLQAWFIAMIIILYRHMYELLYYHSVCVLFSCATVSLTLNSVEAIIVPYPIIWSWYNGRWWVGCYIWYSEEKTGRGRPGPPGCNKCNSLHINGQCTVLICNYLLFCGFYRASAYWRAILIYKSVRLSVRPSVCLSVRNVPVSDENSLTYSHSFYTIR